MKRITLSLLFLAFSLCLFAPPIHKMDTYYHTAYLERKTACLMTAIRYVESRGNYKAEGKSGEYGAYQIMPGTWKYWSKQFTGEVIAMSDINQDIIVYLKLSQLESRGYSIKQIASIWNSGSPNYLGKKGINRWGVRYDTHKYVNKVHRQ